MTTVLRGSDNFDTTPTRSIIRLSESNGNGSTNTGVRRFSTTRQALGADIVYSDSATLGASFTINNAGVYSISYTDSSTAAINFGVSLDGTNLSAANFSIVTAAERLALGQSTAASTPANVSWTGYLPAGSVIRCQVNSGAANAAANTSQVTVARVF